MRATLASLLLTGLALAGGGPVLAQSVPLEIACPADADRSCGIGLVEDGGEDGTVLILRADGAGWTGKRVALATKGERYALQPYAGKVLVFEYEGSAEPPSDTAAEIGDATLLYVIAPVVPTNEEGE